MYLWSGHFSNGHGWLYVESKLTAAELFNHAVFWSSVQSSCCHFSPPENATSDHRVGGDWTKLKQADTLQSNRAVSTLQHFSCLQLKRWLSERDVVAGKLSPCLSRVFPSLSPSLFLATYLEEKLLLPYLPYSSRPTCWDKVSKKRNISLNINLKSTANKYGYLYTSICEFPASEVQAALAEMNLIFLSFSPNKSPSRTLKDYRKLHIPMMLLMTSVSSWIRPKEGLLLSCRWPSWGRGDMQGVMSGWRKDRDRTCTVDQSTLVCPAL